MFDQAEITAYQDGAPPMRVVVPMTMNRFPGATDLGERNGTIRINGVLYSLCAIKKRYTEVGGPGKVTEEGTVLDDDAQEFHLVPWRINQRVSSGAFEQENKQLTDTTPEGGDSVVVELEVGDGAGSGEG